ncbi:MAG: hypothetical protein HQL63_15940 [Magnetococcales bacterium]|nr:hypothetical protein [Magnetococcales bacterium]
MEISSVSVAKATRVTQSSRQEIEQHATASRESNANKVKAADKAMVQKVAQKRFHVTA